MFRSRHTSRACTRARAQRVVLDAMRGRSIRLRAKLALPIRPRALPGLSSSSCSALPPLSPAASLSACSHFLMLNLLGPCHLALSTTLTFGVWTRLFHEQVRALWDFTATSDNEISLEEDDVITLTGVIDGGWWEGDLNGVVGFFPANYVEVVQSDEAVRAYAPRARRARTVSHTHTRPLSLATFPFPSTTTRQHGRP